MFTEETKELVRRYQEAYNSADYDALDDVVAADVLTPNMISSMPRGLEGAKLVHQKTLIGMPDYHTTIEDLIAEGDKVVARVSMSGTHTGDFYGIPPTGRHVELTGIFIVRIANGKSWSIGARRTELKSSGSSASRSSWNCRKDKVRETSTHSSFD